jgi:tight adherence protein B
MSTGLASSPSEPLPAFSKILRDQELFGSRNDDESLGNSINIWFDTLMIQSGIGVGPSVMLFLCALSGMTLGGFVFIIQENLLSAMMLGTMGFVAPVAVTVFMRSRRQKLMMALLPSMIDELARAAKTGRSIEQCWELVGNDTPSPLGGELQECSRRMKMGEDLAQAIRELPYRTGLITLNILVTALSVHQSSGGDLVSVLERLSQTIRDRLLFLGRLRAATVGSRLTAILMLLLPVAIVIFFSVSDPLYVQKLMDSDIGRKVTLTAIAMEIFGSLFILKILQSSQRS